MHVAIDDTNEDVFTPDSLILKAWSKDLKNAATLLTPREVRWMVDIYYQRQYDRIRAGNIIRSSEDEPSTLVSILFGQAQNAELRIRQALVIYTNGHPVGAWMQAVHGIGPVISSGILAHVNIEKITSVGNIWRFAGLDPSMVWLGTAKAQSIVDSVMGKAKEPTDEHLIAIASHTHYRPEKLREWVAEAHAQREAGEKVSIRGHLTAQLAVRPWNNRLKVVTWHAGECFVRTSGSEKSFYGRIWCERKALEEERNAQGLFADQAARILKEKAITEPNTRKSLESGKLSQGHIHARAKRYAVKLFLAHVFEVMYWKRYNVLPPKPYVLDHCGHIDYIAPPHLDVIPDLAEARRKANLPA